MKKDPLSRREFLIAGGVAAGFLSVGGYLAGLWAVTLLPMAPVAALRETSVVFGAIISVVVFRESLGPQRIAAACLVAAGIMALTLLGTGQAVTIQSIDFNLELTRP